ncbi:MAG: hypothetical protein JO033_09015 [Acidobacteriaceae bacterium]|nr:hypothetical protein [Acidobacteriaceae bacterium]MBV9499268.1 hypothetical protein [Acidobacteriaceae bacterium]
MSLLPTLRYDIKPFESAARRRYMLAARLVVLGCILSSPIWVWLLFFSAVQDTHAPSLIFVPLIVVTCVIGFMSQWRGKPHLKQLLGTGILARLVAASLYIWLGAFVYDYSVDAFHYWTVGMQRAQDFSAVGWSAFQPPFWSTNLINNICGFVMLATGNTLPGLFVLFSLAALWGGYFFYRAFSTAFPAGDPMLYGTLALLLPSNLFWSSAIGKDALAQLFIGLTAYGFARVSQRLGTLSIVTCALGIAGVLVVRPHIAAMLAVAVTLPFALGKARGGWMNVAAKIVLVPLLVAVSLWVVSQAGQFVGVETADSTSSIQTVNNLLKNTQIGGSTFNSGQSLLVRVAESPFLMFRPFPWEVKNAMAAVASLEAFLLLWFAWKRRRALLAALRQWRDPYVGFILTYAILFSIAFAAATSNFGILVRQRIMMVPLVLMLFCARLETAEGTSFAPKRGFDYPIMRAVSIHRGTS